MTTELDQAFAHPDARAAANPFAGPVPDRISLRDYITSVEIGAFEVERDQTQRLRFNLVVEVSTTGADAADDVDRILSYDRLTDAIEAELRAERLNLLETLAERVAERILSEPQAVRVFVRIEKLDRGPGALGVEIMRGGGAPARGAVGPSDAVDAPGGAEAPAVVALAVGAQRQGGEAPVVLCPMPAEAPDAALGPVARRRVALLALDQAAWRLADQDPRLAVVGSRTELDWALAQGRPAVWAPSKMLLDGVDVPEEAAFDHELRLVWLAQQLGAREIVCVGVPGPLDSPVPVRQVSMEAAR